MCSEWQLDCELPPWDYCKCPGKFVIMKHHTEVALKWQFRGPDYDITVFSFRVIAETSTGCLLASSANGRKSKPLVLLLLLLY